MRSDKACRAALSLERMAACPPKSIYFQVAVRPHDGAAIFLVTSFGQAKEVTRALTHYSLRSNESIGVRKTEY